MIEQVLLQQTKLIILITIFLTRLLSKLRGNLGDGEGEKNMTPAFKYEKTDAKSLFSLGQTGPGVMALNYEEKSL